VNAPDVGADQHAHGAGRLARAAPADGAKTVGELYGRALVVIAAERYAIANAAYMRQKHNESVIEITTMPELRALAYDRQRLARVAQTALDFVKRFG
jgi:hypothetical protein